MPGQDEIHNNLKADPDQAYVQHRVVHDNNGKPVDFI